MPFNINLYHEVLRARREEQYDPLRLSMIGLGVIVACLAGYYLLALAGKSSVVNEYEAKQRAYDELQPKVATATKEEEEINKVLALADKMTQRIEGRFYWGAVFEQLVVVVPPTVQISRCSGSVSQDALQKAQITMEGIAAGDEPFRVAEDFRVKLIGGLQGKFKNVTAKLASLEAGSEKVTYGNGRLPTAQFTMEISFVSQSTPDPTPPQEPRRAKRIAQQDGE
jgi:Tfp pilus assembly protein PilN